MARTKRNISFSTVIELSFIFACPITSINPNEVCKPEVWFLSKNSSNLDISLASAKTVSKATRSTPLMGSGRSNWFLFAVLSSHSRKRLLQWFAHNLVTLSIAVPSEAGAVMDKTKKQPPGTKFAYATNTFTSDSKSSSNGNVQSKASRSKTS